MSVISNYLFVNKLMKEIEGSDLLLFHSYFHFSISVSQESQGLPDSSGGKESACV